MDISAIIDSAVAVAKAVAPLVGNGAPEAVAVAERTIELIDHIKETYEGGFHDGIEDMMVERALLESEVLAHVDSVSKKLRGE